MWLSVPSVIYLDGSRVSTPMYIHTAMFDNINVVIHGNDLGRFSAYKIPSRLHIRSAICKATISEFIHVDFKNIRVQHQLHSWPWIC